MASHKDASSRHDAMRFTINTMKLASNHRTTITNRGTLEFRQSSSSGVDTEERAGCSFGCSRCNVTVVSKSHAEKDSFILSFSNEKTADLSSDNCSITSHQNETRKQIRIREGKKAHALPSSSGPTKATFLIRLHVC